MKLLCFIEGKNGIDRSVRQMIAALVPDSEASYCTTVACMQEHLLQVPRGTLILVLAVSSPDTLSALAVLAPLLDDTRVILILPDHNTEMLSAAWALLPRYIGYANRGLDDVTAVLNRIIKTVNRYS